MDALKCLKFEQHGNTSIELVHFSKFYFYWQIVNLNIFRGTQQGIEKTNEGGAIENKVETVDYRSQAGQEEPTKENVGVVHLKRNKSDSGSGGGFLASAATAVTNTMKSAKDAVMGKSKGEDTTNTK